ncbi:flagellar associated protein [Toxoplasma gondii ME49]|uniref:Cilia- and flagella-associated protein 52 n=2 Tax=Toxoplasma gondii TaxID=5811 RepID=B6KB83_TOXGV|nr:flagellar associated protein [Toxoplasma gondii ME49]EPT29350.1 flagellar associated protein [Toxoplasma gondii ME49]ESS32204.1 flagellar associated protein [Toxoplasma gondii VEG]|eukprot:XP_002365067.1 flagellar associated protein [Toxoplasma gondii ME49]
MNTICPRLLGLRLHKESVQDLEFSKDESYLATLGGQDDNSLVIWDVADAKAICGTTAAADTALCVKFFNRTETFLLTAGCYHVRIWQLDVKNKKLRLNECKLGKLQRVTQCVLITPDDAFAYCGTQSGDFLEISLNNGLFKRSGPVKGAFPQGITCIAHLPDGDMLVGTGEGVLAKIEADSLATKGTCQVLGAVTSIVVAPDHQHCFVGTKVGNMYWVDLASLTPDIRYTCHVERINCVTFPRDFSEIFATASMNEIRLWNTRTCQELLRIHLPHLECYAVAFMQDGAAIISGWSDGKIRAFLPQSGRLLYEVNDAHKDGVTAIAGTQDSKRIVSGGMAGAVRVWSVGEHTRTLLASLKEHRSRIWSLQLRKNDMHAVSAAADGSIIVWDLGTYTSVISLVENTIFKSIVYHPDEIQLLATGSDRKVHFLDTYDGGKIRDIEASDKGETNCVAITKDGNYFCSGGDDKILRLWGYESGEPLYSGIAHTDSITCCCLSPDQSTLISTGREGAIFVWSTPEEIRCPPRSAGGDLQFGTQTLRTGKRSERCATSLGLSS